MRCKHGFYSLLAGAGAFALVAASIGAARAAPVFQTLPSAGARVELASCWWVEGQKVCNHRHEGHYDYHPGHWDVHADHLDYHPGHYDYHHHGHRHHLDEDEGDD